MLFPFKQNMFAYLDNIDNDKLEKTIENFIEVNYDNNSSNRKSFITEGIEFNNDNLFLLPSVSIKEIQENSK